MARAASGSQIVRIFDETAAHVPLPDAVDNHPRTSGFWIGEPVSQRRPSADHALYCARNDLGNRFRFAKQHPEEPRLNFTTACRSCRPR